MAEQVENGSCGGNSLSKGRAREGQLVDQSGVCNPALRKRHRSWTAPRPTGRTLAYPGASFTQVEGDKILWQRNYFDRQTVAEQLGLKAT